MEGQNEVPVDPGARRELRELADSILRAIGRNLVNLQKVESLLRWIVGESEVSGPMPEFAGRRAKRIKKLGKAGLGTLVESFGDRVLTTGAAAQSDIPELGPDDEAHFAFRFQLRMEPDSVIRTRRSLERLVQERNKLVHGLLAQWDQGSMESGRELLLRLEEQHRSIAAEFRTLRQHATILHEARQEFGSLLQSAEGRQLVSEALQVSQKLETDSK